MKKEIVVGMRVRVGPPTHSASRNYRSKYPDLAATEGEVHIVKNIEYASARLSNGKTYWKDTLIPVTKHSGRLKITARVESL